MGKVVMQRRKKQALDFGPVVLVYFNKPRSLNPYLWLADDPEAGRGPKMHSERFRSTAAAFERVRELWGQDSFHDASIKGPCGELLWTLNDLRQEVESQEAA